MKNSGKHKGTIVARLFLLLIVVIAGLLIYSYFTKGEEKELVIEEREEPPFVKHGVLHFLNAADTLVSIDIEIVDTQDKITQGLMWRKSMGERQGMLFVFPDERPRSFWMKNTYIPLDIIYVDSYGKIVSIVYNAVPFNERSLPSEMPAQYVVEVNADFCNRYGIVSDMRIGYELD